jgi:hypothetical protein
MGVHPSTHGGTHNFWIAARWRRFIPHNFWRAAQRAEGGPYAQNGFVGVPTTDERVKCQRARGEDHPRYEEVYS